MARRIGSWVCAAAAILLVWRALPSLEQGLHTRPGDGVVDWLGARAWLAHVNVYSPEGLAAYGLTPYGFAHPPTAPFWLLPFAAWDVDMLGTMMGWVTILLTAFHLVATFGALRVPSPLPVAALAFGLALNASWLRNDLDMAQVSEPIAFVYLLTWLALRGGRDVEAGLFVGLACTFKPFAGVLWLMLLSLRRWRAAATGALAWLAIAILMTARFGLVSWLQWNAFNRQTAIVWLGHLRNATLPGVVLRAFYPVCRGDARPHLLPTLIAIALGAAILWACHALSRSARAGRPLDPSRVDLVFAAWATASVFVNPVAWEHYAFLLMTPLAIVGAAALDPLLRPRPRAGAAAAMLIAIALLAIDMHDKLEARSVRYRIGSGHLRLHLLEAANWLPWAIALAAALWLLRARDRALSPQVS